jgi:hypothetical protein
MMSEIIGKDRQTSLEKAAGAPPAAAEIIPITEADILPEDAHLPTAEQLDEKAIQQAVVEAYLEAKKRYEALQHQLEEAPRVQEIAAPLLSGEDDPEHPKGWLAGARAWWQGKEGEEENSEGIMDALEQRTEKLAELKELERELTLCREELEKIDAVADARLEGGEYDPEKLKHFLQYDARLEAEIVRGESNELS